MLPTYEKVLEGVVKKQLNEHMEANKIVIYEQFGFRKNHSCETAINMIQMDHPLLINMYSLCGGRPWFRRGRDLKLDGDKGSMSYKCA